MVQLAKQCGARVIATAGSDVKAAIARESGADVVIDYRTQDFKDEVLRATAGAGVDVVYDGVGLDTWEQSMACLKRRGMLVLFGNASGA